MRFPAVLASPGTCPREPAAKSLLARRQREEPMSVTATKTGYAAAIVAALIQIGSMSPADAAYSICAASDNIRRQYVVCGGAGCPAGDLSVFSHAVNHPMCGNGAPQAAQAPRSCGRHWTDWQPRGRAAGNPCPSGCKQESRVRDQSRGAGRRAEHREQWQCTGTPR